MVHFLDFNYSKLSSLPIVNNKNSKTKQVYNYPFSFDIETTNFIHNGKKYATMYIWQFGIGEEVVYGRTWEDFIELIDLLNEYLNLNKNLNIICYVHNLGFEFQFLKKHIPIKKLFARQPRKPMWFLSKNIIFKDSLVLSGLSLKRTLEEAKVEHSKTDGLDYSKYRHYLTPLNEEELEYCENDVLGLNEYIFLEMAKNDDNISKIPTTKTGYARRYTKNNCFKNKFYQQNLKNELTTEPIIFRLLQDCFSGAYTHANFLKVGMEYENVASYDFTSSYPAVMLRHKYPRSRWYQVNPKDKFEIVTYCIKYCVIMQITLHNVNPLNSIHPLSISRCKYDKDSLKEDNGKIVSSKFVTVNLTSIDFLDIVEMYSFDEITIHQFYFAEKDYLPREFIISLLELYKNKCTLKHVEDKQDVYLVSKGMLNALYGMAVTNPIDPDVKFDDELKEWYIGKEKKLKDSLLKIYNSNQTFLNYAWGVFVTAYARHELFNGIKATLPDFIYADTDSIKITNKNKYKDYFTQYNFRCTQEVKSCLNKLCIPYNEYIPKNMPIGVWDYEGDYEVFKTLGAKRYAFIKDGEFNYTVAGLPKKPRDVNKKEKVPLDWILEDNNTGEYGMDFFNINLTIPKDYSCKLASTYVEEEFSVPLTDYLGNTVMVSELSCLYLGECDFKINFSDNFYDFITGVDNPLGELIKKIFGQPN